MTPSSSGSSTAAGIGDTPRLTRSGTMIRPGSGSVIALLVVAGTLSACASSATGAGGPATSSAPATSNPLAHAGRGAVAFYLRPVWCQIPAYADGSASTAGGGSAGRAVTKGICADANASEVASTSDSPQVPVILGVDANAFPGAHFRYVLGPADLAASAIAAAAAEPDAIRGRYLVTLTLTRQGTAALDQLAGSRYACYRQNPDNPPPCSEEALDLGGLVESAPTFEAARFNGDISITGNFSAAQAAALARRLQPG